MPVITCINEHYYLKYCKERRDCKYFFSTRRLKTNMKTSLNHFYAPLEWHTSMILFQQRGILINASPVCPFSQRNICSCANACVRKQSQFIFSKNTPNAQYSTNSHTVSLALAFPGFSNSKFFKHINTSWEACSHDKEQFTF